MMVEGAREGTGRRVACDDLFMGTKTGTAEKVASELCLHVELAHLAAHARDEEGREVTDHRACRAALVGRKAHERSCYTSSMCAFGRVPGTEREVLVLVVVEEPRHRAKFGADVAGPAAVAVLREALGRTRGGAAPLERVEAFRFVEAEADAAAPDAPPASVADEAPPALVDPDGFAIATSAERNPFERPWSVDVDASDWALCGEDEGTPGAEAGE
jgi:hypothetical protein